MELIQQGNKNTEETCDEAVNGGRCGGRREFLVNATMTAGGLVLGLSKLAAAQEGPAANTQDNPDANNTADEVVVKLADTSPLSKVGGSAIVDTPVGKVIVAHTSESNFVACSAVCTHKGGILEFDAKEQRFFCPLHFSIFGLDGAVQRGPARKPIESYSTQSAAIISLKKA